MTWPSSCLRAPSVSIEAGQPRESDHVFGDDRAAHTLIQYGDYECPYCLRDERGLERLLEQGSGSVRFVFRHFPLTAEHPNAFRAARAAEAAGLQGKFWAMHRQLMGRVPPLDDAAIAGCAEIASVVLPRLWDDMDRPELAARVEHDVETGRDIDVRGTPWYLLDSRAAGPLPSVVAKLRAS